MGEVFVADDLRLGRQVAVKLLPAEYDVSLERRKRFEREARAVAALSHPNIVAIYDFGEEDGRPFAVTELLEGETLRATLRRGPLRTDVVVTWGAEIAEGLAAAHEQGVVHRDLKPENVFVTRAGHIKILDFGLARLTSPDRVSPAAADGESVLTEPLAVLGTVGYMSPEQVRGESADARLDAFALGAVLYEMLTGSQAFRDGTTVETLNNVLNASPRRFVDLRSSEALGRVIRRCLEKRPDHRFQSAREVACAMEEAGATAPRVRRRRGAVAGGVTAIIAVAAAVLLTQSPVPTTPATTETMTPRIVVLPFENLGPPDDEYFAVGLSDEITTRLAAVSGVAVISRSSARPYAATLKTIRQIAAELRVDYILEGTVQWEREASAAGGRIRVTPRLIRASDDTQLWGDRYDRNSSELFAVQSEIAQRVAAALNVTVGGRTRNEPHAPTRSQEAYQAYLRGLYLDRRPDGI